MSSTPMIYVSMERVDANALITSTGWPYITEQKVSVLFDRTWGDWRSWKLAYGVQRPYEKPTQLKWFSIENDPSMIDLFKDISLDTGENYYLLISKFPDSLGDFANKDRLEHVRWYVECADRFGGFLQTHGHVHVVEHVDRPQNEKMPEMVGLLAKLGQFI